MMLLGLRGPQQSQQGRCCWQGLPPTVSLQQLRLLMLWETLGDCPPGSGGLPRLLPPPAKIQCSLRLCIISNL